MSGDFAQEVGVCLNKSTGLQQRTQEVEECDGRGVCRKSCDRESLLDIAGAQHTESPRKTWGKALLRRGAGSEMNFYKSSVVAAVCGLKH